MVNTAILGTIIITASIIAISPAPLTPALPGPLQMHSLMEHFALEHNLGKVVELFAHMLENRMKPTTNTFRILITACQRAGQVELAFEVLSAMKARGLIPREVRHALGRGVSCMGAALPCT